MTSHDIWIGIGFFGQAMFGMRFIVQWLASEREGKSVIPLSFWYLSIAGAAIVLVYAIYRLDPVFIVGQAGGFLIYIRNLYLIRRERSTAA
ncbi:MAG: lipid-A-disaccharide synthase N-terminal domain-containing protein [Alphaproteobacteria bacterium]